MWMKREQVTPVNNSGRIQSPCDSPRCHFRRQTIGTSSTAPEHSAARLPLNLAACEEAGSSSPQRATSAIVAPGPIPRRNDLRPSAEDRDHSAPAVSELRRLPSFRYPTFAKGHKNGNKLALANAHLYCARIQATRAEIAWGSTWTSLQAFRYKQLRSAVRRSAADRRAGCFYSKYTRGKGRSEGRA